MESFNIPQPFKVAKIAKPKPIMLECQLNGCGKKFDQEEGFSIGVGYACPGKGYNSYGCEMGQHWACSHEHAKILAHACIDYHLEAGHHG